MFPVIVGLNHRTAPLHVREKVVFHHSKMPNALQELKTYPGISGIVIISTCNRTEIYAATTDIQLGITSIKNFMAKFCDIKREELEQFLYTMSLNDCVKHLYRVVSGLDSMVLGETEIIGQVAYAYEKACRAGVTNKLINVFFQNALTVGKRVRTETAIDQHPTSVSYVAVQLARKEVGTLEGKNILVVGAGQMSSLTAKHLFAAGARTIIVSNRSYNRALSLAQDINGTAISQDKIFDALVNADIVISATTSSHYMIPYELMTSVMEKRNYRPLLMIDIAVPRDIDPRVQTIDGITLFDIDKLNVVIDEHQKARQEAALQAEKIIEEETMRFLKWHNSLFIVPTIVALRNKAHHIKEAQLTQALNKLGDLSERQEKIIRSLANSIVNQLLHTPITNLRKFADTAQGPLYTEVLQNLFDLKVVDEASHATWNENQPPTRQERAT